jgi:type I restriction enzyme S subunit
MRQLPLTTLPLGSLVSPIKTWNPIREAPETTINYIDLSSIDNRLKRITSSQQIAAIEAPSRARQLVQADDILVSTVRPNLNGVARVPDTLDGATASTGYCVLRANPAKLSSDYLFHWVRYSGFVSDMVRKATGASYPAISDRIIQESGIPLPTLHEQRRVAAILDQADQVRQVRQKDLAIKKRILSSVPTCGVMPVIGGDV